MCACVWLAHQGISGGSGAAFVCVCVCERPNSGCTSICPCDALRLMVKNNGNGPSIPSIPSIHPCVNTRLQPGRGYGHARPTPRMPDRQSIHQHNTYIQPHTDSRWDYPPFLPPSLLSSCQLYGATCVGMVYTYIYVDLHVVVSACHCRHGLCHAMCVDKDAVSDLSNGWIRQRHTSVCECR